MKLLTLNELLKIIPQLRKKKKKIIFTNGCFDIIHIGHIKTFQKAKEYGDILIVGLNSDSSVRKLKGKGRPLINQKYRAEILSAIEFIDYIIMFDEDTPEKLIKAIRPDILLKGSDYKLNEIVGAAFVKSYGGKVIRIRLIPDISTTRLIKKIKEL